VTNSTLPPSGTEISGLRFAAALTAVAAVGVAQWYIRQHLYWTEASLAFVAAAGAAGWLLGRPRPEAPVTTAPTPVVGRLGYWLGPLLIVIGVGLYATGVYDLTTAWNATFDYAAPLTVFGVALWSLGLALRFPRPRGLPWLRWETVLFIAILAIGLVARFYRYDYYPPDGVCAVEEPQSGQWTYLILEHGARPWEFVGDRWLAVPFFMLFGVNLTSLRMPYTIVSWLTLIPFYLLMRSLVSRPAALFATALFALSSWHLMYARLAHAIFPTTLIAVIVLYLSVRVHQRGGLGTYVWIGFLCAYTMYTYAGYRGTPAFAALFLGISLLLHVREWHDAGVNAAAAARRKVVHQIVGMVVAILAFVGPIIVLQPRLAGENTGHFLEAARRSMVNTAYYSSDLRQSLPLLWERTLQTFGLFNHFGDGSETFNLPGEPHLDPITGVLMAVALSYCLIWGWYRWQGYFASVFLVLLIAGAILVGNFDPRRLQGVIPLIFVMIAFVSDRFVQAGANRFGAAAGRVLLAILAVVALVILYLNWHLFFGLTISDKRVRAAFQNQFTAAARYLTLLPDNAYLVFVSDIHWFFRTSDLEWMRDKRIPGQVTRDLLPVFMEQSGPWDGRDLRVLVQDPLEHEEVAELLQARFPGATCADASHPDRPITPMTACDIPLGGSRPFSGGARARYFRGDSAEPFLERIEPAISWAFVPAECRFPLAIGKPPCSAEWKGTLVVEHAGTYNFIAKTRQGEISVWIDEQPLEGPLQLTEGTHHVRARARFGTVQDEGHEAGARLLWKAPSSPGWQLVPFVRFD
jgi:hypothetical protein